MSRGGTDASVWRRGDRASVVPRPAEPARQTIGMSGALARGAALTLNAKPMDDTERLRHRLRAIGAAIPDELVEVVSAMVGPMLNAQEKLTELDLGDLEPFSPRRLADDAA